MPTSAVTTWTISGVQPAQRPDQAVIRAIKLPASVTYAAGTVLGEKIGNNEVQTATITGSPTGGTFTLTFGGQTTAATAYNATAATVQANLEALSTIGSGNVSVSGSAGGPYTVTFQNDLGYTNVAAMTASGASLTGGSSPSVTIATSTAGSAGTPGTFTQYASTATDGSQTPKCILQFATATDSNGNHVLGTSSTGQFSDTVSSVPAFFGGSFYFADVPDLTEAALTAMNGTIVSGSIAGGGIFKF